MTNKVFEMFWMNGTHRMAERSSLKAAIRMAVKDEAEGRQAMTRIAVGIDEGAWREVISHSDIWDAAMAFERAHTKRSLFGGDAELQSSAMRKWQDFIAKAKAVAAAEGIAWE